MEYSEKASESFGKTLKFDDVKGLSYKYRAERSAKTPRYRFVNRKRKSSDEATSTCNSPTGKIFLR
jgi:hypothetical protein